MVTCGIASDATRGSDKAIWGESIIQEKLDGAVRNKVVYQEKLQQQGYYRDWEQFRTKIKNLKNTESQWRDGECQEDLQIIQGIG